jgi:beta-glucosidase
LPKRSRADTAQSSEGITAQVEVVNTGDRRGQEVVQLYLRDPESRLRRPPQALRDFQKVALDPGASTTVRFALEERDFAAWDDRRGRWIVGSGPYEVRVGTSSRDLPLRQAVTIEGPPADQGPVLDRHSTIRQWLENPQGREVIEPLLTEMTAAMGDEGGGPPGTEEIFGSLPLSTLSALSGGALTESAIEDLVEQVRAAKRASTSGE